MCNGTPYLLRLDKVLYIPSNWNNLISLGHWDTAGGQYTGGKGVLTLITKDGTTITKGNKIDNNLYKMKVTTRQTIVPNTKTLANPQTFAATEPAHSWETWHRRYGHVSYSGLQKLLDKKLVEGFTVDTQSPKPDCAACTEAKQSVKPFNKTLNRKMEPGDLTHIDLWGKYDVVSINGNQYYILFMDDSG